MEKVASGAAESCHHPSFGPSNAAWRPAGRPWLSSPADAPLWQATSGRSNQALSAGTFAVNFRRYLGMAGLEPTGVHVLRHTAAKLRREVGATVEDIASFLDHTSLAVTTT